MYLNTSTQQTGLNHLLIASQKAVRFLEASAAHTRVLISVGTAVGSGLSPPNKYATNSISVGAKDTVVAVLTIPENPVVTAVPNHLLGKTNAPPIYWESP